jgi:DNA-binding IclR family transcriptional regulator
MRRLQEIGVTRQAAYRCLQAMEDAGLVALERGSGRRAVVTILER